jgi:RNA polymerase sigma-70 factor (ECF subfamily)
VIVWVAERRCVEEGIVVAGAGQANIIAELYEEYETVLLRYALRLTHDTDWAADLVQDTFVRSMGHVELLRMLKKHQRRAWLYRTLKNRFLDQQQMWKRREDLNQEIGRNFMATARNANLGMLANPFDLVPEQYRELVHMRYVMGMNSSEISEKLGIPAATVRSRLHLAMKEMRRNRYKLE